MARKIKKPLDVQKFGGTENLGQVKVHGHDHDSAYIESKSKTSLESDAGYGDAAIIRCFTFGMNPTAFNQHPPTKQELFNAHFKGIEIALWKDGMQVIPEVNPQITFDSQKMQYKVFVGAKPMKGHILKELPQTLRQITNGQKVSN